MMMLNVFLQTFVRDLVTNGVLIDWYCFPIVQVFHGADHDVLWLQRDFGIYVVGMFDTHQASRTLGFARHRLQDLLRHYCSVETDKQFQLEDWRIRFCTIIV